MDAITSKRPGNETFSRGERELARKWCGKATSEKQKVQQRYSNTGGFSAHQAERQHWFHSGKSRMIGTTVLCVRKGPTVIIIADGQVTLGSEVVKPNVRKVRRIGENVIGGFAGATADSLTLFERLETQLDEHSAVELAKQWRTDKFLRRLDAVMVVADADISLTITGNGDVLEPPDGIVAIGSGGPYATAAARALIDLPSMDAEAIALKAMKIAADCCIYTNHNFTMERIITAPDPHKSFLCSSKSCDTQISHGEGTTSIVPTSLDLH
ncbi:hypothetical protein L7F22_017272 [Adiantum nelumboides]|nr:hypothetical protein [Adiantum nelumboides]